MRAERARMSPKRSAAIAKSLLYTGLLLCILFVNGRRYPPVSVTAPRNPNDLDRFGPAHVLGTQGRILFKPWLQFLAETTGISKRCPDFILFTVSVTSAHDEAHHLIQSKPNIARADCAVSLLLDLYEGTPQKQHVLMRHRLIKLGWNVLDGSAALPPTLSRRVSRFPKLQPSIFFPSTKVVLYCDAKYLSDIKSVDSELLAKTLLNGTEFGIIQHPSSGSLMDERNAIVSFSKKRPYLVDSTSLLDMQVLQLSTSLSVRQLSTYGVEGGLHAHKILGDWNAASFQQLWIEEYLSGCDRDQIAFYGAAARANMKQYTTSSCPHIKFDRVGKYESVSMLKFRFAIHCDLPSVLSMVKNAMN